MGNYCCTGDKKKEYETNLTSKGPYNNILNDNNLLKVISIHKLIQI